MIALGDSRRRWATRDVDGRSRIGTIRLVRGSTQDMPGIAGGGNPSVRQRLQATDEPGNRLLKISGYRLTSNRFASVATSNQHTATR